MVCPLVFRVREEALNKRPVSTILGLEALNGNKDVYTVTKE